MTLTVYADVLVITNLYVDFFLLWCADRTLHLHTSTFRLTVGALTGALCALECLIPHQPTWLSFGWGILSAFLTAAAAFLPLVLRTFLQAALCLWGFSFLLAGFFLFLIRWLTPGNIALLGHAVYLDLSPVLLFLFTGGAYLVFWLFHRLFPREDLTQDTCKILVEHGGIQVTLWAKADTGSALREPFSGLPVIVCQASSLKPLAPPEWKDFLASAPGCPPAGSPMRLIPFESVGGAGMLPAFRPDKVLRLPQQEPLDCYVALWDRTFSAGQFQALYNPNQFSHLSPLS